MIGKPFWAHKWSGRQFWDLKVVQNFAGFTLLTRAQVELFTRQVWGGVDFLKWMVISGKTYFAASFETNYRKSDGLRHCNRNLTGEKLTLLK